VKRGVEANMIRQVSCVAMLACLYACSRHTNANSDCKWPDENSRKQLNLTRSSDRQHLSEDSEFAEDLAIRYADVARGLHTNNFEGIAEYNQARNTCMARLFRIVAGVHGVSAEEVGRSLGHRRVSFDLAVFFSFALLYGWGASLLSRWLCGLYGSSEAKLTVIIMTVLVSLLAGTAGVMLGEQWSWIWETYRIGNQHMSYRAFRIPWTHHRGGVFLVGTGAFLLIAGLHRSRLTTNRRSFIRS
jgi:hypothetical protein